MEAFFQSSMVLGFAFPKEQLADLVPECLELDVFDDKWAFVAVAMVQTKNMRPKGFPKLLGRDFFLMGYRIFVRYKTSSGRKLRGLYILKSDTDSFLMKVAGNLMTDYHYHFIDATVSEKSGCITVDAPSAGFAVSLQKGEDHFDLPLHSPFADWKEARRFAGPMPFTFTYKEKKKEVLMIEGVRNHWKPKPVKVHRYAIPYLESLGTGGAVLANAFIVENVPYYWEKGIIDPWKPV